MPKYKTENVEKVKNIDYCDYVEKLILELGDLISMMQLGKTQRYSCLKSRKKTKRITELLKVFRMVSINHQKHLDDIISKNKEEIKQKFD